MNSGEFNPEKVAELRIQMVKRNISMAVRSKKYFCAFFAVPLIKRIFSVSNIPTEIMTATGYNAGNCPRVVTAFCDAL